MSFLLGLLLGGLAGAGVLGVLQARREAASVAEREASAASVRRLVDESPEAVVVHAGGTVVYANAAAARLGRVASPADLVGKPVDSFIPRELQAVIESRIRQVMELGLPAEAMEERLLRPDGTSVDLEVRSTPTTWEGQPAAQVTLRDITERKRTERQLVHDAFHDALTGLPNRALLLDRLDMLVEHAKRREDFQFAVLFLDLDRFKDVNDSLGHLMGDQLLVSVSHRLQHCIRPNDTVARFAGDEFAVLLDDIGGTADALRVADRILEEVARPHRLEGHEVFTSASIGIALSGTGYETSEAVLRDADLAMYRAKAQGRARHEVFDRAMHERAMAQLKLETDLRLGLDGGAFRVFYQPVVDLESGRITAFEALLRWSHPTRGLLLPDEFMRLAEETGLIVPIGWWALEQACRQQREWRDRWGARAPARVSVNMSPPQVLGPDLPGRVEAMLSRTGCPPEELELELSESIFTERSRAALEGLAGLEAAGVRLCIDRFGTGSSSLVLLHRFRVDALKFDRTLLEGVAGSEPQREVLRTLIGLAGTLDLDVVAGGVERSEELEAVRALGCGEAQGYLIHRPVPAAEAGALLEGTWPWSGRSGAEDAGRPRAAGDASAAPLPDAPGAEPPLTTS